MHETVTPALFAITASRGRWQTAPHLLILSDKLTRVATGDLKRLMVFMPPRSGKLVADATPVLTTGGWTTHGALKVGDHVFGSDGKPARVCATSTPGIATHELEFTDGSKIKAHSNHEWCVYDRASGMFRVCETGYMQQRALVYGVNKPRAVLQLPLRPQIKHREKALILHPYVLGAWLGDGSEKKPCITHAPEEIEVVAGITDVGYPISTVCRHNITGVLTTYFADSKPGVLSTFTRHLREIGVYGNKHIPEIYKLGSVTQRLELLAGLIDTDGCVSKDNRVSISTCSDVLAEDIRDLIRSLGWRAGKHTAKPCLSTSGIQGKQDVHVISFTPDGSIPTRLPRKHIKDFKPAQRRVGVKSITGCDPEPGKCIQVDNADGLYLIGREMIVTHNSQLISQFFPAWYLGHHPDNRIILTSYEADFAATWGWKARSIFEEFAPDIFGLSVRGDSSARNRWDIVKHVGGMNTAGVGGAITGKGADLFIIDDPVKNAEDANSQLKRDKAWDWYQSTAYTRLEPDAAMILIMTRWHPEDLGGLLLKEMDAGGEQWDVLKFPAIAEENDLMGRKVGEPLWKERYPIESLNTIQGTVSAYWWAAMYQQSPYARTGKTFKRADFIIVDGGAQGSQVRFWDLAATEESKGKDPDWTVGCLMSESGGRFWIKDVIQVREDAAEVERIVAQAALMDGKETRIFMEQEGGASGKSLISYYARNILKGYSFEGIPSTGSKPLRAQPLAAAVANGNVHLIAAGWNSAFLDEAEQFPNGAHDDQCLVAGTMITTDHGDVSIEKIRRGDMVLTRSGYHPVVNSGITNKNAELYKVVFSNGSELIGTSNHPVFIEGKGFIHMDAITNVDQPCYLNASTITGSISGDTHIQKTAHTEYITDHMRVTSKTERVICTKKYGKPRTGTSQKGTLYTTLILTRLTTTLKIWNASLSKNIRTCTCRYISPIQKTARRWKETLVIYGILHLNGMGRPKALNGIKRIVKSVGKIGKKLCAYVSSAERSFLQKSKRLGIAQTHVVPDTAESTGCKTLKEHVLSVETSSQLTETTDVKHVAMNAAAHSTAKLQQSGTVYNLEVSNAHEYFANGILVHNCDAASQSFNMLFDDKPDPGRFKVAGAKRQ